MGSKGKRDFQTAEQVLRYISSKRRFAGRQGIWLLKTHWREAVGEMIAENAIPIRFSNGQLTLAVRSTAWANELQYQTSAIIEKLNKRFKRKKIKSIKMKSALKYFEIDAKVKLENEILLSDSELEKVEKMLDGIEDDELKESIRGAYKKSLKLAKIDEMDKTPDEDEKDDDDFIL